jgi:hypothetical protein
MPRSLAFWLLLVAVLQLGSAGAQAPATATFPFTWRQGKLTGPGADHLRAAARTAQFVLIGEGHNDRDTPLFVRSLYSILRHEDGFNHLVVEQDPLGIELALAPAQRGNAVAIGKALQAWPTLLGFASDQDLELLADAGAEISGSDAIWGLEQAQSPVRYLEELSTLAPAGPIRTDVGALLERARAEERSRADFGKFLAYDPKTLPDLKRLAAMWRPAPIGRTEVLLSGLLKSAEIYNYYIRAHTEHDPAFTYLNGTVRESWLKAQFIHDYRANAIAGNLPRALFKFGDNHIRRGIGSTGAWTLGTFATDLATFNGMDAYSILVVAIGSNVPDWAHLPPELRPILPTKLPGGPELIDLKIIRPHADAVIADAEIVSREETRAVLFGFDAIILLPNSGPATWLFTGFPPP